MNLSKQDISRIIQVSQSEIRKGRYVRGITALPIECATSGDNHQIIFNTCELMSATESEPIPYVVGE